MLYQHCPRSLCRRVILGTGEEALDLWESHAPHFGPSTPTPHPPPTPAEAHGAAPGLAQLSDAAVRAAVLEGRMFRERDPESSLKRCNSFRFDKEAGLKRLPWKRLKVQTDKLGYYHHLLNNAWEGGRDPLYFTWCFALVDTRFHDLWRARGWEICCLIHPEGCLRVVSHSRNIHLAMVQNQWYHFGVGALPISEPILVGMGMFTGDA